MTRVYRFTIANVETDDVAKRLQDAGLLGATLWPTLGVSGWGIEPGVTIETTDSDVEPLVRNILLEANETCAYATIDGSEAYFAYPSDDTDGLWWESI